MNPELKKKIKKHFLLYTAGITLVFIILTAVLAEKSFKESFYYKLNCQPQLSIVGRDCEPSYAAAALVGGFEGVIVGLIYAYIFIAPFYCFLKILFIIFCKFFC